MEGWTLEEQVAHRRELCGALRSGHYTQTHNKLRRGSSFCCLGVGCEISGLGHWVAGSREEEDSQGYMPETGGPSENVLPAVVQFYYGFDTSSGMMIEDLRSGAEHLASLNDIGFTFAQIADIIEYYYWDEDHAFDADAV